FALDRVAAGLQHLFDEVDHPVARRFLAHERAAPLRALARQDSGFVAVRDPLVLAEEVADLTLPDADVACRHVRELAEVTVELGHEALTEPHHLAVGASFWIEVRAALRAADRHSGDSVLERLLEAEKLDDPEVDRRMEAQAALVR